MKRVNADDNVAPEEIKTVHEMRNVMQMQSTVLLKTTNTWVKGM